MKVLFIYTNINGFHEDLYSFGLASIVSMTGAKGHDASVIIVKKKSEYSKILDAIYEFKPEIVGFSSVSSQFEFIKEIAALIKAKAPGVITVCGGVHPTISPGCLAETGFLDGVFVGESENSFIEFLNKVENGREYKDTDNFAYTENNKLVVNKLKPLIADLNSLPYPDRKIYPFRDNLRAVGFASFFFSRGCPYLCAYCSNHAIAKVYDLPRNYTRYRSPESSIREIEQTLGEFCVDRIYIGDDIFGLNRAWRKEFCKMYKKRIKVKFACLLRADIVDKEYAQLLSDAGCYQVSIGIESGNEHVRNDIMNRRMSNEQIIKAFEMLHKYGMRTNAINIIGTPGETEEMMWDTIRLNRRVKPAVSGVNIFYPYKGTKLGDLCFEKNLVNKRAYQDFSNERRETILNYPEAYKEKLVYYRENWEALVYPFDLKRHILKFLRRLFIWRYLHMLKRVIVKAGRPLLKSGQGK